MNIWKTLGNFLYPNKYKIGISAGLISLVFLIYSLASIIPGGIILQFVETVQNALTVLYYPLYLLMNENGSVSNSYLIILFLVYSVYTYVLACIFESLSYKKWQKKTVIIIGVLLLVFSGLDAVLVNLTVNAPNYQCERSQDCTSKSVLHEQKCVNNNYEPYDSIIEEALALSIVRQSTVCDCIDSRCEEISEAMRPQMYYETICSQRYNSSEDVEACIERRRNIINN